MASRSVARSRRALSPASSRPLLDEFVARGWRYRWQYGATVVASRPALGQSDRRPMLPEHFMRTVVPQMERRRARKLVAKAKPPANFRAGEVRWVAWHAPGDEYPVWGLFLSSHRATLHGAKPANDTFVLIAWGDGPALAWADDEPLARAAVCAALRVPPPWLECGMLSGDPTFPVRIERISRAVRAGARSVQPSVCTGS